MQDFLHDWALPCVEETREMVAPDIDSAWFAEHEWWNFVDEQSLDLEGIVWYVDPEGLVGLWGLPNSDPLHYESNNLNIR